MNGILLLLLAIICEVAATTALRATEGFTRLLPSLAVAVGYGVAFVALSHSLKAIPIGVAYATWAGLGTIGVALLGRLLYSEVLATPSLVGILLIAVGVGLMSLSPSAH